MCTPPPTCLVDFKAVILMCQCGCKTDCIIYVLYKIWTFQEHSTHIQANKSDLLHLIYPGGYTFMLTTQKHFMASC